MIKKFLQKIFKSISYEIFFRIYGKIEKSICSSEDKRIEVKTINIDENLSYRIFSINNGRLYTDRIHDTAVLLDNKIIKEPSFQLRYKGPKIYNSEINENVVFKKGTPKKLKELNGSVLSLLTGGGGNKNYWHWLFDVLPRLGLCSKNLSLNDIDYFLLPSHIEKFQIESLDCLLSKLNIILLYLDLSDLSGEMFLLSRCFCIDLSIISSNLSFIELLDLSGEKFLSRCVLIDICINFSRLS